MVDKIIAMIGETLLLDTSAFTADTPLLGAMPELDSIGVIMVLTGLEEKFGLTIADDEVDASIFETVSTLAHFVSQHA